MGDHLASQFFFSLTEILGKLGKLGKFANSTGISKKNRLNSFELL